MPRTQRICYEFLIGRKARNSNRDQQYLILFRLSYKGRTVDALALGADEGRN